MSEHRRTGLTRQVIIEVGLRLLDEVGLDGLTVRRLATELDVQSPALYWHLRNKQDLLDGMAEAVVVAAGMGPPRDGESWSDWLARRARAYRASLLSHRDGARLVVGARGMSPATLRAFDAELSALVHCGFTPVLALRTISAITDYVHGFVLREQADRTDPAEMRPDPVAAVAALLDGGESAAFVLAVREGGSTVGEQAFEHGLRALVLGTAGVLDPPLTPGAAGSNP